ncbi:hypothetical protein ACQIR8_004312 [Yersinia enterocolitica]|nr:hypothetical protein [Yersinia enterocolitica]
MLYSSCDKRSFATSSQSCYTTYGLPVSKMWITSLGLHNLVISRNADVNETEHPKNEFNHSPANNSTDAAKNNECSRSG